MSEDGDIPRKTDEGYENVFTSWSYGPPEAVRRKFARPSIATAASQNSSTILDYLSRKYRADQINELIWYSPTRWGRSNIETRRSKARNKRKICCDKTTPHPAM